MFSIKLKQDHFTFSAGCIMSDHVLAPSIFPCSQRKEKKKKEEKNKGYFQILFFIWEFLSKAVEPGV